MYFVSTPTAIDRRYSSLSLGCCRNLFLVSFRFEVKHLRWTSACISANTKTAVATLVVDQVEASQIFKTNKTNISIQGGGSIIIGQEQDDVGGQFDPFESLRAHLADLHIINNTIGKEYMIKWCTEDFDIENSFANFKSFEFYYANSVSTYKVNVTNIIRHSYTPFRRFFSSRMTFSQAQLLCHGMGGALVIPMSQAQNRLLYKTVSTSKVMCNDHMYSHDVVWLGGTDSGNKNVWQYPGSNVTLNYSNFWRADNARNEDDNCITFIGCKTKSEFWHSKWSFTGCDQTRRVICDFRQFTYLKLRGFDRQTGFDFEYFLNDSTENPQFIGVHSSVIRYIRGVNNTLGKWQISDFLLRSTVAVMTVTAKHLYPIGLNEWQVSHNGRPARLRKAILTSCGDRQYTCDDGSCIRVDQRCDFQIDCSDGSDENECNILVLPKKGYYSSIPPPRLLTDSHFPIMTDIKILQVSPVDLIASRIIYDIELTLHWIDSSVNFKHLKKNSELNDISLANSNLPWIPSYEFLGQNFSLSDTKHFGRKLRVIKQADPLPVNQIHVNIGKCKDFIACMCGI